MIDWSQVSELRNEVGAEDFDDLVEIFLGEVEEEMEKLSAAMDAPTLSATLHFLKGSALNLGFRAFADLCQTGETDAANGRADTVNIDEISDSYTSCKEAFLNGLGALDAA